MSDRVAPRAKFFSFRWKAVIAAVVAMCLFSAAGFSVIYLALRDVIVAQHRQDLAAVATAVAGRIASEFSGLRDDIISVVSTNKVLVRSVEKANASYGAADQKEILATIKEKDRRWVSGEWELLSLDFDSEALEAIAEVKAMARLPVSEIFVTDRQGALVAASGLTSDYYQADEAWWEKAYNGGAGSFYLSELEYDASSGIYAFSLATPIYNQAREAIGILKLVIDKEKAFRDMFNVLPGRAVFAGVVRSDRGDIFSLNLPDGSRGFLPGRIFESIASRQGESAFLARDGSREYLIGFAPIQTGLLSKPYESYVYCAKSYREIFWELRQIIFGLVFLWSVLILLFSVFVLRLSKILSAPLAELRQGFLAVEKGDFDCRMNITSGDELQDLGEAFNKLISELRAHVAAKNYFQQIIENVSDILFVTDAQGKICLANRRACDVLGMSQTEILGRPAADILAKKDRYIVSWGLKGLIEEGSLKDKRVALVTASGRAVDVYLGTRALRDASRQLLGLVCLAKDLTETDLLIQEMCQSNKDVLECRREMEKSLQEMTDARDALMSMLEDALASKAALEETLKKLREGT